MIGSTGLSDDVKVCKYPLVVDGYTEYPLTGRRPVDLREPQVDRVRPIRYGEFIKDRAPVALVLINAGRQRAGDVRCRRISERRDHRTIVRGPGYPLGVDILGASAVHADRRETLRLNGKRGQEYGCNRA